MTIPAVYYTCHIRRLKDKYGRPTGRQAANPIILTAFKLPVVTSRYLTPHKNTPRIPYTHTMERSEPRYDDGVNTLAAERRTNLSSSRSAITDPFVSTPLRVLRSRLSWICYPEIWSPTSVSYSPFQTLPAGGLIGTPILRKNRVTRRKARAWALFSTPCLPGLRFYGVVHSGNCLCSVYRLRKWDTVDDVTVLIFL